MPDIQNIRNYRGVHEFERLDELFRQGMELNNLASC